MEFPKRSEAPLTVLVADDIEASRALLADMVQSFGYRCIQAINGRDALHCIDTLHPDIVLLDLLMPDIDGFEITRLVRQRSNGRWLPVIVTSSLEGDEHFIRKQKWKPSGL